MPQVSKGHRDEPPILLVKWYDVTKWLRERVESFPKNQRYIFGQRLAPRRKSRPGRFLATLVPASRQKNGPAPLQHERRLAAPLQRVAAPFGTVWH